MTFLHKTVILSAAVTRHAWTAQKCPKGADRRNV